MWSSWATSPTPHLPDMDAASAAREGVRTFVVTAPDALAR